MRRRVKLASVAACIAATAAIAQPVAAQYAKPEDAVKYRKAAFTVMNSHMGRIFAQLKSPTPNMQVIQSSAQTVESMSKLPWDAFAPTTEMVADTRALPALYKNEAKAKDLARKCRTKSLSSTRLPRPVMQLRSVRNSGQPPKAATTATTTSGRSSRKTCAAAP